MSNENPIRKQLPHTAKFCKLEQSECVVRPGQIVFRNLNPQLQLLYQKPPESVEESDEEDVTPKKEELTEIHMSLDEFIDDVVDTSVYLIDQFEMSPKGN